MTKLGKMELIVIVWLTHFLLPIDSRPLSEALSPRALTSGSAVDQVITQMKKIISGKASESEKMTAVDTLGELNTPKAVEALCSFHNYPDTRVARKVAEKLGGVKTNIPLASETLKNMMINPENTDIVWEGARSLCLLLGEQAIDPLIEIVRSLELSKKLNRESQSKVRLAVRSAIGRDIKGPTSGPYRLKPEQLGLFSIMLQIAF